MKKFLTVLLVIAVMFTFSFGSAFAATPADADKVTYDQVMTEIADNATALLQAAETSMKDALATTFGSSSSVTVTVSGDDIKLSKESVEKVYKKYYDAEVSAIGVAKALTENNVKASMNVVLDGATKSAVESALQTELSNPSFALPADATIEFAGFFNGGAGGTKYDYDSVLKKVYVYPAYDATVTVTVADVTTKAEYEALFKVATATASGTDDKVVGKAEAIKVAEAAKAVINATDLNNYSKVYNGAAQSPYDRAAAVVNTYVGQVNTALNTAISSDTFNAYHAAIVAINAIYTAPVNQQAATGTFVTALAAIPKISDEPTEAAKIDFAKKLVLNKVLADISTAYDAKIKTCDNNILTEKLKGDKSNAAKIAAYEKQKADLEKAKADVTEVATYLVNDQTELGYLIVDLPTFDAAAATPELWAVAGSGALTYNDGASGTTLIAANIKAIVEHVAELKEEAALLKASIEIDGTTAVQIDEALEKAIKATYYGNTTARLNAGSLSSAVIARINELLGAAPVKVNDRSYNGVGAWGTAGYEADQNDELRAVIAETKSAVGSSKTIADADAAFLAGYAKLEAIPTTSDKNKATSSKEYTDLLAKYTADINALVAYKEATVDTTDYDSDWDNSVTDFATRLVAKLNLGYYSVDELTAAFEEAKTEVNNIKTAAALDAEKVALNTRLAAIPKTVTVADKETVVALVDDIDAFNDYCTLIGSTKGLGGATAAHAAKTFIQKLEDKAITDAYNAIMKDDVVSTDEADAVKALRDAYEQYVADYTAKDAALLTEPTTVKENELSGVNGVETKLAAAEVKAVQTLIAKLPADGSDPAAVKAAREAFDALSLEQQVAIGDKYYAKLVDAEKLNTENAKAYVQDLSIKARSTKTSKGVKVTIKADVQPLLDAGFTVEYKFYRSTKSNKNFGKAMITKTTGTYTNTKGVKGTKYYYKAKLVVKNAEGEVVATTPLTQCLYATRTF